MSIVFADTTQNSGNEAITHYKHPDPEKKSQLPAAEGCETERSELFQSAVTESSNKAERTTSLRCQLSTLCSTRGS